MDSIYVLNKNNKTYLNNIPKYGINSEMYIYLVDSVELGDLLISQSLEFRDLSL